MKNALERLLAWLFLATALQLHGQGYVYDQQSATTPLYYNYDSLALYKGALYQSFVPTLSSIGFVQLEISDDPDTNTSGARICVSICSGSPSRPTILGTSGILYLASNFNNDGLAYSGIATFDFATAISLTPGQTYYLTPVELTGDNVWSVAVTGDTYQYGQLSYEGTPFTPSTDVWFREGITVPEPSDVALWTSGGLLLAGILGFKGRLQQLKSQHKK